MSSRLLKSMKTKIAFLIFMLALVWLLSTANFRYLDILYQNPNSIVRHFAPTWRTLQKISDLYYLPRSAFYSSKLPHYELTLSRVDFITLLEALPKLEGGKPLLTDADKQEVRAKFRAGDFTADVRVRQRGLLPNHWSARKKSWNISFLNTTFNNSTALRLVLPEDRGWAAEFLEAERARKLGVLTPNLEFVRLKINGKDYGVYTSIENWEPSFFKNKGREVGEIFAEQDLEDTRDIFRLEAIDLWQARINPTDQKYQDRLANFLYIVSETSDYEFARRIPSILNMDAYYGWALEVLLARNYHSKNEGNLNFYFDPSRGMFEPIAFDMFSWELGAEFDVSQNRLLNRILKHKPFRKEFERRAREYVNNPKNLEEDLAYYDTATKSVAKDIMSDFAKLPPTQDFLDASAEHRKHIISNIEKIKSWLEGGKSIPMQFANETYPLTK